MKPSFLRTIAQVDRSLNLLAGLSVLIYFLMHLRLEGYPLNPHFSWYDTNPLFNFIADISRALIGSYIFYIINIKWVTTKKDMSYLTEYAETIAAWHARMLITILPTQLRIDAPFHERFYYERFLRATSLRERQMVLNEETCRNYYNSIEFHYYLIQYSIDKLRERRSTLHDKLFDHLDTLEEAGADLQDEFDPIRHNYRQLDHIFIAIARNVHSLMTYLERDRLYPVGQYSKHINKAFKTEIVIPATPPQGA